MIEPTRQNEETEENEQLQSVPNIPNIGNDNEESIKPLQYYGKSQVHYPDTRYFANDIYKPYPRNSNNLELYSDMHPSSGYEYMKIPNNKLPVQPIYNEKHNSQVFVGKFNLNDFYVKFLFYHYEQF